MSHRRRMQRHLRHRRAVHLLCHFSCLFQIIHFLCSIHRREWLLGIKCEPCWINWWDRTTVGYQRTAWLRRTGITVSPIIEGSSLRDDSIDETSSTTDEWWESLVSQRVTREIFLLSWSIRYTYAVFLALVMLNITQFGLISFASIRSSERTLVSIWIIINTREVAPVCE